MTASNIFPQPRSLVGVAIYLKPAGGDFSWSDPMSQWASIFRMPYHGKPTTLIVSVTLDDQASFATRVFYHDEIIAEFRAHSLESAIDRGISRAQINLPASPGMRFQLQVGNAYGALELSMEELQQSHGMGRSIAYKLTDCIASAVLKIGQ
jgi:hypothetical protein